MTSHRITCPDCKSVLRPAKPVPDGKKIKCPKCGTLFTAPGLGDDEEERPRKKESSKQKAKVVVKKAASPPPPPKPASDDDEDEGGLYGYIREEEKAEEDKVQIEYAPDMSIKDLRGPAQAAVVSPSNLMMLIGGVSCLCNIFLICERFWPMVFTDSVLSETEWKKVLIDHYKDDKSAKSRIEGIRERTDLKDEDDKIVRKAEREVSKWRYLAMGGFILLLIYNGVAIIGAVKMQNLESRGWGIASSIMILLPMGSGGLSCLAGGLFYYTVGAMLDEMNIYYSIGLAVLPYLAALFVGVSALRVLFSQEVIDGFEYVAE